jgi:hypothetical protein
MVKWLFVIIYKYYNLCSFSQQGSFLTTMPVSSLPVHEMTPPVKEESGAEHNLNGYVLHIGSF